MSDQNSRAGGIYFNSADSPVFLDGITIGGHEYVYLEGQIRVPGHFVPVKDPKDNPDAPETFRAAYGRMMEKAAKERRPTRQNSAREKANIVPMEEKESAPEPSPKPKPTKNSRTRKGGSDTPSGDEASK